MSISSDVKLVNLGNLQTFKQAYDSQTALLYLSKEEFLTEGIIKADKLPSYVDDVIEIHVDITNPESPVFYKDNNGSRGTQLTTGETGKIYVDLDATTDGTYRWSGSAFVKIGNSVSTADKALKDGSGNVITDTYVTKSELSSGTGLAIATASSLGGVKIGDNINVTNDGTISVAIAGANALGVVKVGDNLSIDENGVLTAITADTSDVNGLFSNGE